MTDCDRFPHVCLSVDHAHGQSPARNAVRISMPIHGAF